MPNLKSVFKYALVHKLVLYSVVTLLPLWDTSSLLNTPAPETILQKWLLRMRSWDTIYFTSIAQRGVKYEHEYAFANMWPEMIRSLSPDESVWSLEATGILLSLVFHFVAIFFIYHATRMEKVKLGVDPATAAKFYTIYMGGIFLISGYSESIFAAISFFALTIWFNGSYILSGMFFALSVLYRSNGIIWGALFLAQLLINILYNFDFIECLYLVIGGICIGLAFVLPQVQAYTALCPGAEWCNNKIPSIYLHVQGKYWGNGLFKYWTMNNIPNFLFAMPSIILLALSVKFLVKRRYFALAFVHLIILMGALTSWHVQILNRISSCLPGMAWYLASLHGEHSAQTKVWVTVLVGYTIIQAALFGAFMPPA